MEKKVCLISRCSLFEAPYLKKYYSLINKFDIIYWQRHSDKHESCEEANKEYIYGDFKNLEFNTPIYKKIWGYIGFAIYVLSIIKKCRYDVLIFFDLPVPLLLSVFLLQKYRNKYIIDIRDVRSYFTNKFFLYLEKKIAKNSICIIGTSPKHKIVTDEDKFFILHNDQNLKNVNALEKKKKKNLSGNTKPLVVAFIGGVRYHTEDFQVINALGNDKRFILKFIGRGSEYYAEYLKSNNIKNVFLKGEYLPEEMGRLLADTDLLLNLYGNKTIGVQYALSNKLYFSARSCTPILVCNGTVMADVVDKYGIGLICDLDDQKKLSDRIYNYYSTLDWEEYCARCKMFIERVEKDNERCRSIILAKCN